jgi:hypothetical protein
MDYSSRKYEEEYFDKWSELNNDVVEVDIKKLYRLSYTTDIPEFDVIYHNGVCTCKYEKQSRSSTYYKTIGNYKRENKFTPDKIHQIEKLDWFWAELQRYKKGITDKEKVVELFSYLDIEERDICIEIVRKTKCIDLQEQFKQMKQGVRLINTARGAIIDENALAESLHEGRLYAMLDVTDPEPPAADNILRNSPYVTLTPHIAGHAANGKKRQGRLVAEEIEKFLAEGHFRWQVTAESLKRMG